MATGNRIDPYSAFRFRVEINGIQTASFSEATVPDSSTDAVDYREGIDPPYTRKLSLGPVKYGSLSLKKGVTDSMELYNWRKLVEDKGANSARRNISLILLDAEGNNKVTWNIFQAWPSKYDTTGFNATGNEVMVETLEIALERIERVK